MARRETHHFWVCNRGTRNTAEVRRCGCCDQLHHARYAEVRSSERTVIDVGRDGSISVPGRNDYPLHPKQIAAGIQRVEVESAIAGRHSLKHLESLVLVHEATNWNSEGANMPLIHEDILDVKPKHWEQILNEPDAF